MKQYQDLLRDILDNGTWQDNRTGIRTKMLPGAMLKFDLRDGFPAVTTKKLYYGAVTGELIGFLRGYNTVAEFNSLGCKVWDANGTAPAWLPKARFDGDLQKIYGYQWRKWDCYDKWMDNVVLVRQGEAKGIDAPFVVKFELEDPDYTDADDFVGNVYLTKHYGDIKILKKLPTRNGNTYYRAQFLKGTNTIIECSRPAIRSGTIKNPFAFTDAKENGCYGIITKTFPYLTAAYNMWLTMMERCHGDDPIKTVYYKNKGVFVDSSWRCFANFFRDIHSLVGFDKWAENPSKYDLDKDYCGNNFYGKNSTIFLPNWYIMSILPTVDGSLYTSTNINTNEIYKFTSPEFFNKHTKTRGIVDHAFREQNGKTQKWTFSKELPPIGYAWRQQFYLDQIETVIHQIKTNPTSRRLLVTAWRPDSIHEMALPPCHYGFQVIIEQESKTMHLLWNQRSVDVPLGLPWNIASYATLLHILARITGYNVGTLTGFLADVHIYENQIEGITEQLTREPLALPTLILSDEINFDTKIEEVELKHMWLDGYQSYAAIKMQMAV